MTTKELDEAVRLAEESVDTWECATCNGKRHPNGFAHSQAVRGGLTISVGDFTLARALLAVMPVYRAAVTLRAAGKERRWALSPDDDIQAACEAVCNAIDAATKEKP